LAGIGYIALRRVQEAVDLTNGILIGFTMIVPVALIALVLVVGGGREAVGARRRGVV
jgi:hypothetical protein